MFDNVLQPERAYRQLAAQQRDMATRETLPNVRQLLERSAEKWEALADAITVDRRDFRPSDKHHHEEPPYIVRAGNLTVNRATRLAVAQGNSIPLTPKEFALVELLAIHVGQQVTKEMLMDHIYPGRKNRDPKMIDVYVCKLRKKLIDACGDATLIHTHHGSGYQLDHEVADAA